MDDGQVPLNPAGMDLLSVLFLVALLALTVAALVSLGRARAGSGYTLGWAALILLVPILGPLGRFIVGRRTVDRVPGVGVSPRG